MAKKELELLFLSHWQERWHLPQPEPQYQFAKPARSWACDFCWPDHKLIVELEGGTWSGGRHISPKGFRDDCIKYNTACGLGYRVVRFTSDMLAGENIFSALKLVEDILLGRDIDIPLSPGKAKRVRNSGPRKANPQSKSKRRSHDSAPA
jgi:hypothetical protein